MNYQAVYERLCARGNARLQEGGHFRRDKPFGWESHHIKPRCLGGGNSRKNLSWLTPREHFVAHALLCRMHPDHKGLADAAHRMSVVDRYGKIGSRVAARLKEEKSVRSRDRLSSIRNSPEFIAKRDAVLASDGFRAGAAARMVARLQTEEGRKAARRGSLKAGAKARDSGQASALAKANLAKINSNPENLERARKRMQAINEKRRLAKASRLSCHVKV